jgi:hypothetical protein
MSWRTIVISNTAKLDYQMGYLVVRQGNVTKIHLGEIATLLFETTSASLTVEEDTLIERLLNYFRLKKNCVIHQYLNKEDIIELYKSFFMKRYFSYRLKAKTFRYILTKSDIL